MSERPPDQPEDKRPEEEAASETPATPPGSEEPAPPPPVDPAIMGQGQGTTGPDFPPPPPPKPEATAPGGSGFDPAAGMPPPPPPPKDKKGNGGGDGEDDGDGDDTQYPPPTGDDKNLAMVAVLSPVIQLILCFVPIFLNIIIPLVIWLIKKGKSPFIEVNAWQALGFNVGMTVIGLGLNAVFYILGALCPFLALGGCLLTPVILVLWIYVIVMAAMTVNKGEYYILPVIGDWLEDLRKSF